MALSNSEEELFGVASAGSEAKLARVISIEPCPFARSVTEVFAGSVTEVTVRPPAIYVRPERRETMSAGPIRDNPILPFRRLPAPTVGDFCAVTGVGSGNLEGWGQLHPVGCTGSRVRDGDADVSG